MYSRVALYYCLFTVRMFRMILFASRVVRRELKLMNGKILNSKCTMSLIVTALYSESSCVISIC